MPLTVLQRPLVLIFANNPATIASLESRLNTTQKREVNELIEHSPYGYEEPTYSRFHGYRGTHAERLKALRNLLIEMTLHGWEEEDSIYDYDEEDSSAS
jgi:hypothetical protein